jgi:coenzyme Q-binding protein COQ10
MTKFHKEHYCEFSVKQLYDLIIDIEKYPEFIPWCTEATIIESTQESIKARLKAEFKKFCYEYTSVVTSSYSETHAVVEARAIDGPFEYLINIWTIEHFNNVTKISLDIDFQFKISLLDKIINALFSIAYEKMFDAFEARAESLYHQKDAK